MHIPYTICFLYQHDQLLMLLRNKAPNKGKWNGLGGKIEENESLEESILREIKEESGLTVHDILYKGVVTWNNKSGMHVFTGTDYSGDIHSTYEGQVGWKPLEWVLSSNEVVSNIPYFIQTVLFDSKPFEHAFTYNEDGEITVYKKSSLLLKTT
ncbi:8-oxo-dGTP diphosphatase [Bacillus carboniphilus]|uniref:8-oxo-dGTP diphosphatase n=1 Tax=Bacillus carboniphilus TaxID=86663 RepID=A0ABN0VQX7_9BACI